MNTAEIFPLDLDFDETNSKKYLRPEFFCSYERPLKSDVRKNTPYTLINGPNKNKEEHERNDLVELNEASRYLKLTIVPHLVNLLDSLSIIPIDSESLEESFHS